MKKKEITTNDCIKWKENKLINPHSGYEFKAKEKSKEYKRFKEACKDVKTPIKDKVTVNEIYLKTQYEPITRELCFKWIANNKLINPLTNSKIDKSGKLYKEIEKACIKLNVLNEKTKTILPEYKTIISKYKKIIKTEKKTNNPIYKLKNEPTKEDCEKWLNNKLINPQTNIKIKKNGEIYMELKDKCNKFGLEDKEEERRREDEDEDRKRRLNMREFEISPLLEVIKKEKIKKEPEEELKYLYYPELDDINFNKKLLELKEISIHKIDKYPDILTIKDFEDKATELCSGFNKSSFQYLMAHYLSYRTPYRSLLIYYDVGVGKTCTAITIAESLLINHNSYDEPKIWVILPKAIEGGFKNQIFDMTKITDFSTISAQCTGDTYVKLGNLMKNDNKKTIEKKIKNLIKSRYKFFTYESFANYIDTYIDKSIIVKDKVIIIDEAHNIRNVKKNINDNNKRVFDALEYACGKGINNRLIFLTATPMYNEQSDIYTLFYLLLLNDKRLHLYKKPNIFDNENKITKEAIEFISLMSSNYISYLRGKNPFNFAIKISPRLNGVEMIDRIIYNSQSGNLVKDLDKNWLSNIEDGLVLSKISEKQKLCIENKKKLNVEEAELIENDTENKKGFMSLTFGNIVYEDESGVKGFNNFFIKQEKKEQLIVKYSSKYKNTLSPQNIGIYSGKFAKIAEIIKKSQGIIVIYSKFIWAGIIPLAIMLEHMGFTREGTTNILAESAITENINYENIKYPKYCILSSSDPVIMGNTTIDGLIGKINNPLNINGELIKVILMTPVASEGLNFKNIREIHILDPWYHFNRIDQIIGRGIRNCSHSLLPIEKRNVTVYLHCSIYNYEKESPDIHAYRISAGKLYKTFIVDEIIRNNAIDCALFKNINYFPKEMFKLGEIELITSQGNRIKYKLGDDEKYNPVCKVNLNDLKENKIGFREETYKHLAINIQQKIKKIVLEFVQNNKRFISYEYLKEIFRDIDITIILHAIKISIYPNILINNIILLPHEDGLHIIDVIEDKPLKINLIRDEIDVIDEINELDNNLYKKFKRIRKINNYYNAVITLYKTIDEITFKLLINKIIGENDLNEIDKYIEDIFIKEGILIRNEEVPSARNVSNKYIGFVNIYNETFEPLIYNNDGLNHNSFNKKQMDELIENRNYIKVPEDFTQEKYAWGLMVPVMDNNKNKINVFKLLTPGIIYGKKTGIVCLSLQKNEHHKIMIDLGLEDVKNTKVSYCNKIAVQLATMGRLTLLPVYKPK